MDRRNFLSQVAATAAFAGTLAPVIAAEPEKCVWPPPNWKHGGFPARRWVNILNMQTGERFKNIYCEDARYVLPSVQQFSWVCRDWRAKMSGSYSTRA